MSEFWSQFLMTPPIIGVTINEVWLSTTARNVLYAVLAATFLAAAAVFLAKRNSPAQAVRKAILAAFLVTGILYAVRADYGWMQWLEHDLAAYGGLSTTDQKLVRQGRLVPEERVLGWGKCLYDFVLNASPLVRGDYVLYAQDPYILQRTEYFLLPYRRRSEADTVIVLLDNKIGYDAKTRTLTRDGVRHENRELALMYAPGAGVFLKR